MLLTKLCVGVANGVVGADRGCVLHTRSVVTSNAVLGDGAAPDTGTDVERTVSLGEWTRPSWLLGGLSPNADGYAMPDIEHLASYPKAMAGSVIADVNGCTFCGAVGLET